MKKKILSLAFVLVLLLAMSVPALAAEDVTVDSKFGPKFVVPNVSETKTYTLLIKANELTVSGYTIPSGTKIDTQGTGDAYMAKSRDGKLDIDYDKQVPTTGGYKQFDNAGTYIFLTGGLTGTMFVLKVDGSGSTATTTSTTTPTESTDKNTVKVAGENRTPGQIQTYRSGGYLYTVNHGDTLYDLSKRFYDDGNLWKELQKVNQEWLSETKDGIIFVGYNLLIPDELGGVRVNVG